VPIQITAAEAEEFLRDRGHRAQDLVPLSGGLWSTTYAFRENGREYVVRFHERRDDLEKDRFAARWASPALRVPHIVEIGDLATGAYGISERVRGGQIDELDAEGMRRILPSLFAAMDAMRGADLAGTSGWGLWHGDGNAPFPTWREMLLRHSKERDLVASHAVGLHGFDAGTARMRDLLAFGPDRRHLVHDDLLYHNVFADELGVVLLDWGASIYGDFLYDAALLTFWWPYYEKWRSIDIDALVREHFARGVPHFGERLRLCEMDIGVSHIPFQLAHRDASNAAWTAKRTIERASAPL
jgi:aminoglycoside phosphotransferase (APT) family kinase protein